MSWLSSRAARELRKRWLPVLTDHDPVLASHRWQILGDGASGAVFLNVTTNNVYKVWSAGTMAAHNECRVGLHVQTWNPMRFAGFEDCWSVGHNFVGVSSNIYAVDLHSIIDDVELPLLADYMLQLLDSLDLLHRNNLAHNDIKLENILITPTNRVVLTDWGASTRTQTKRGRCGTPAYRHPGTTANRTSDYYSALVATFIGCDKPVEIYYHIRDFAKATLTSRAVAYPLLSYCLTNVRLMRENPGKEYDLRDSFRRVLRRCRHGATLPTTRPGHPQGSLRRLGSCGQSHAAPAYRGVHAAAAKPARAAATAGLLRAGSRQVLDGRALPHAGRSRSYQGVQHRAHR